MPAYAANANHWADDRDGTFSIGIGGRYMIFEDISLVAEWIPVLAGYKDQGNGWAFGLEKKIGGHVFQVFVLNSGGLTPAQSLPGGDLPSRTGTSASGSISIAGSDGVVLRAGLAHGEVDTGRVRGYIRQVRPERKGGAMAETTSLLIAKGEHDTRHPAPHGQPPRPGRRGDGDG